MIINSHWGRIVYNFVCCGTPLFIYLVKERVQNIKFTVKTNEPVHEKTNNLSF